MAAVDGTTTSRRIRIRPGTVRPDRISSARPASPAAPGPVPAPDMASPPSGVPRAPAGDSGARAAGSSGGPGTPAPPRRAALDRDDMPAPTPIPLGPVRPAG